MDKKIRIVTFQNAYNYGAVLQCYALQNTLENMGNNDVKVLNYRNINVENLYRIFYKPSGSLLPLRYMKSFFKGILYLPQTMPRNKTFSKFIAENINLTEDMTKEEIMKFDFNEDYTFVAGSDQIWNTNITHGSDDIYTLNFGKNMKRISYAASIGNKEVEEQHKEYFKKCLSNFDNISIREETGKNALKDITEKTVEVVLDPTLLLDAKAWTSAVKKEKTNDEKYIFVYMANQECVDIANDLKNKTGYKIIYIDKKNLFGKGSINDVNADPFDFVNYIKNAEYVITTSFHATVFSIIFNKNFWVVPPKKVGSRITDILNKLELTERSVNDIDELNKLGYDKKVNYKVANEKLEEERKKSIDWLKNAIVK